MSKSTKRFVFFRIYLVLYIYIYIYIYIYREREREREREKGVSMARRLTCWTMTS